MRLTVLTLVALATGSALVGPATAAEDVEVHGGIGCRYSSVPPPGPGPMLVSGPMHAVTVVAAEPGPATDVVVTCSVQLNSDDPASADVATESSIPGIGVSALAPTPVSFTRMPGDRIYVCTVLTWTDPDGSPGVEDGFDADPATAGIQCHEFSGAAVSAHPPIGRGYVHVPGLE